MADGLTRIVGLCACAVGIDWGIIVAGFEVWEDCRT
jgi:hypothetical protein